MYGRPYQPRGGGDAPQNFLARSGSPATIALIAVNVVTWLLTASQVPIAEYLVFTNQSWPIPAFWSVFTWPFLGAGHPLSMVFACLWAWWIGGSLERSWGTRTFVAFMLVTSVLTALSTYLGGSLLHLPVMLSGLSQAIAAPTVAWCLLNRRESILFYFVPVPAMAIAALTAVILWYEVGAPVLGLFALSGCAAAWWYVTQGRYPSRGYSTNRGMDLGFKVPNRQGRGNDITPETASRFYQFDRETVGPPTRGFNVFRWWRERQERKRLEEIFRRSGYTDSDDR